jgi:hypothetical protein
LEESVDIPRNANPRNLAERPACAQARLAAIVEGALQVGRMRYERARASEAADEADEAADEAAAAGLDAAGLRRALAGFRRREMHDLYLFDDNSLDRARPTAMHPRALPMGAAPAAEAAGAGGAGGGEGGTGARFPRGGGGARVFGWQGMTLAPLDSTAKVPVFEDVSHPTSGIAVRAAPGAPGARARGPLALSAGDGVELQARTPRP